MQHYLFSFLIKICFKYVLTLFYILHKQNNVCTLQYWSKLSQNTLIALINTHYKHIYFFVLPAALYK